ncbi:MAG: sulfurtransferase complex subunit TusB [Vibrionaceae bacterium]
MLHLVKQSPFASDAFANCLRYATADDAIVLLQDAVLALLPSTKCNAQLMNCACKNIFALQEDVFARAVFAENIHNQALASDCVSSMQNTPDLKPARCASSLTKLISIDELVDLTVQYENSLTW